jgi:hypothetical protein
MANPVKELQNAVQEACDMIDKLIAAMDAVGDDKLCIDDRMEVIVGEMPDEDVGEDGLQLALLFSAYDQLTIKYKKMLEQGASLGRELGRRGDRVLL